MTTTTTDVPTSPAEVEVLLLSLPFWSHDHFPAFWLATHRLFLSICHMISINNSYWLIPVTHFYFYIIYIWAYNSGMQIEDLAPSASQAIVPSNGCSWLLHVLGMLGV